MTERLFNALETCLQIIEQGGTIDSALTRYPDLAVELRPILEASLHARTLGGFTVPEDAQRRGRARVLQHAAEMREARREPRRAPRQRTWLFNIRPLAVTVLIVAFFLTSTGLVRASNGALPGDNLYPVKRTWEDVTLVFATNPQHREKLELTYETERVDEIHELLAEGRAESVTFSGYVTQQTNDQWTVAGVPVIVNERTSLPPSPVTMGAAVMVTGQTDSQGVLVAERIDTVAPGAVVPEIDDGHESDSGDNSNEKRDNTNDSGEDGEDRSGSSSDGDTHESDSRSKMEGVIQNMNGSIWTVDGRSVDVSTAEIIGTAVPGAAVIVEGYYNADGIFIATRITFTDGSNDNTNISDQSDDNNNDHNDGNSNDDHNDNDSSNDNGGGGDNSND